MATKITSNLLYAACNLKQDNNSGVSGTIHFDARPGHPLTATGTVSGLKEGLHGFHIHEKATIAESCTGAGGHYNPQSKDHGGPDDANRHVGDLGNIGAGTDGKATVHIYDSLAELDADNGDFNVIGRAIVVHAGEDDLGKGDNAESKITGNAGARVACCVISEQAAKDNAASNMAGIINGDFTVSVRQAELFSIGMISGLLQKDDLTELEKCLRASNRVIEDVSAIVDNMSSGLDVTKIIKAVQQIGDLTQTLPTELEKCPNMGGDAQRLMGWGSAFYNSPITFMSTVTARTMSNIVSIFSDTSAMIGGMTSGQWEQAGIDYADILNLTLGELPGPPGADAMTLY